MTVLEETSVSLGQRRQVMSCWALMLLLVCSSCEFSERRGEGTGKGDPFRELLSEDEREKGFLTVLLFSAVDCPISNRYAPTLRKLIRGMEGKPVHFSLVYPEPEIQQFKIEEHLELFRYPCEGRPDPNFELVKLTGATVTPEAVVIDSVGKVVYRGRIDNRHKEFGKSRPKATTRDLGDAIEAVLAGKPVHEPFRPAVGCYISTE
jgi:hypothetical protein